MAGNKTKPTARSVTRFLQGIADPQQRKDSLRLVKLMREVAKAKPKMWGPTMIGFGEFHYRYASGREGDIFMIGFSPRRPSLVLYQMMGAADAALLKKLGRYKRGGGCLYIKRLDDIHLPTLKKLLRLAVKRCKTAAAAGS